jgi:hypothetical protein
MKAARSPLVKLTIRLANILAASSLSGGCVVEDRNFDEKFAKERAEAEDGDDTTTDQESDTTTAGVEATLCNKYCDEIMVVCVEDNAVFATKQACLSACALLEESATNDASANSNTIECRYKELQDAKEEAEFHCPRAAIASQVCGAPCETYCQMHPLVCGDIPTEVKLEQAECERRCAAVPKTPSFSLQDNYRDDSIQCRLIHLVSATQADAETHCPHARIATPEVCGEMQAVNCKNYCKTLSAACTGEFSQFTSDETCERTCMALPAGTTLDRDVNTVGCRHYHAYASLGAPELHCSHAGPTTDGHCGDPPTANCENYCVLAKAACPDQFEARFETTVGCMDQCMQLPGAAPDSEYPPVESETSDAGAGQVLQRHIQAATQVLGKETSATCDAVFPSKSLLEL